MLKALHRFTQLLRVHIYVPGCCKYIRITNGLQPLAALCMDGRFADAAAVHLSVSDVRSSENRLTNHGLKLTPLGFSVHRSIAVAIAHTSV